LGQKRFYKDKAAEQHLHDKPSVFLQGELQSFTPIHEDAVHRGRAITGA
jgi:hypothetical protein